MKKFLIFLGILVIIFTCNTKKVYAMQSTSIIIDYETQDFKNMYNSTLINKLENLKNTIDSYNIHDRNFVISLSDTYIYVGLDLAHTSYINDYCSSYYVLAITQSYISSQYTITSSLRRGYCSDNKKFSTMNYTITMEDFINDNTSTFLSNIQNDLTLGYGSNSTLLMDQNQEWGYNNDWANLGYIQFYYTQKVRSTQTYNAWIYYSSLPIYYANQNDYVNQNNKTIEEWCNITPSSTYWSDPTFYYSTNNTPSTMNCGDRFTTYYEQMNNKPTYEFNEVSKYNNWNYQIKNFDTYFILNDSGVGQIELEQENIQTSSEITSIKYYGKKCENNTCYWEELGYNTNLVSISNDQYTRENDSYIYQFNYNVDLGSYQKIKISFAILPKGNENYSITFRTTSNIYATITTDMNTIAQNYNLETIIIQPTKYKSYLINSKSEYILYYFYAKYPSYYMNGNLFTYKWEKSSNEVEQFQNYNEINIENYWLTIGNIQLGPNAENYLYMYLSGDNQNIFIHNIYFSDKVLYTESNNNVFTQTYQNQETQIIATKLPDMVISDMKNSEPADINGLIEKILEYEQYKNDWLELFYGIYDPLPTIIKDIFIIMYTMILCYAVFLIFKD